MPAFSVHAECDSSAVQVVRLNDGRFQLLQPGDFPLIIDGYQHILVASDLISRFHEWGVIGYTEVPVIIFRRATGEQWNNYHELKVIEQITPDNIVSIDSTGLRVWHFDNSGLFVSPALKERLESNKVTGLVFYENFGGYCG